MGYFGETILGRLRPRLRWVGLRHYWKARWRMEQGIGDYRYVKRIGHKPKSELQRGWMPGRWRLDCMRAPRRVVNPAVRFWPINRAVVEIQKKRKWKRPPLPWERRNLKRAKD